MLQRVAGRARRTLCGGSIVHWISGSSAIPRARGSGPERRDLLQQLRQGSAGAPATEVDTSHQQRSDGEAVHPAMQMVMLFVTDLFYFNCDHDHAAGRRGMVIRSSLGFEFFWGCRATATAKLTTVFFFNVLPLTYIFVSVLVRMFGAD